MADDFTFPIAGGTTFAADDVGGKKFQRMKLTHGADGSAVDASSANPLPVSVVSGGTTTYTHQSVPHETAVNNNTNDLLLSAPGATSAYAITGYSFTSWFAASLATEERWEIQLMWLNSSTPVPIAAFMLSNNGDHAVYAGGVDCLVGKLPANEELYLRPVRYNGSQSAITLFGHVSYYVFTP